MPKTTTKNTTYVPSYVPFKYEKIEKSSTKDTFKDRFIEQFKSYVNTPGSSHHSYLSTIAPDQNLTRVEKKKAIRKKKVIQVSCMRSHTLVLLQDGSVYSMGDDSHSELGLGSIMVINGRKRAKTPHKIDPNYFNYEKVIQVSAGIYYSMVLTQSGSVYAWGDSHHGKNGLGNLKGYLKRPRKIDASHFSNDPVRYIKGAMDCCFFVTQTNRLYMSGLMTLENEQRGSPFPMPVDPACHGYEFVSQICVQTRVLLLTSIGNVYELNKEMKKHVSHDGREFLTTKFLKIDSMHFNNEKVQNISSMRDSYCAVTDSGKLYNWKCDVDNNDLVESNNPDYIPGLINPQNFDNEKIVKVSQGQIMDESPHHILALTHSGKVFSFGHNNSGQLGRGWEFDNDDSAQIEQRFLGNEPAVDILASSNNESSFAVTTTGKLYVWGSNGTFQLGIDHGDKHYYPSQCGEHMFGSIVHKNNTIYNNQGFNKMEFEFQ